MKTIEQVIQEWTPYLEQPDFNGAVIVNERRLLYGTTGYSKRVVDKLREMGVDMSFSTAPLRIDLSSGAEVGFYHISDILGRRFSVVVVIESEDLTARNILDIKTRVLGGGDIIYLPPYI